MRKIAPYIMFEPGELNCRSLNSNFESVDNTLNINISRYSCRRHTNSSITTDKCVIQYNKKAVNVIMAAKSNGRQWPMLRGKLPHIMCQYIAGVKSLAHDGIRKSRSY